ncbi:sulfatase-like hydrolase/transferase [Curvibacter sp. APW13]|uniref:sulfatase-like hydrolase/transferase n=1 Tax=Curvibacter sp. APW13 TaxID=3077236 RepID=UPI0028DE11FB|nr:sulfatase-like hydrolase/transferase [Curvibacter sp. APW13]MDT8991696.1 sulfatase-like hydrolase/transferase [Curvibacter sp. APW13]
MTTTRKWLLALIGLAALSAGLYANRLVVLQYSLGWYTDLKYPRAPNHPVAWEQGPTPPEAPVAARPPNIVVILADDLGINDVSTHGGGYGAEGAGTPSIDDLANQGVRFDRGYAAAAVCTVSRAALLTGRYPWRFGVEFTPTPGAMARVAGQLYAQDAGRLPVFIDQDKARSIKDFNDLGMPPSEYTMAEALKARGYHTVHIGKWHLGSTREMRPNNQGFDETLFMESGLHLPENSPDVVNSKQDFDPIDRFLWPNMRFGVSYNGGQWFEPAKYLADYYTDEAVKVIEANRNRPFFLYLAHWGVHTPLQASKADYDALSHIKDHRRRVYLAMIRSIDRSVGRVMEALRKNGLDQNTLVVFTSDNGAPGYIGIPDVNAPYRGWKLTHFEGGLRVPFVASWPGHIAPRSHQGSAVSNIDIFPTLLAAAGARPADGVQVDGLNLLPHLGKAATPLPSRPLFWRDGPLRAMQQDDWKLIRAARPDKQWLFNLKDDPTEQKNRAAAEPARVQRMQAAIDAHHATMPPPRWESFIELPISIDKTLDQPYREGDEYTYWSN